MINGYGRRFFATAMVVLLFSGCLGLEELQMTPNDASTNTNGNPDLATELFATCRWLARASGIALCKGSFNAGEAERLCQAAGKNGRLCSSVDTLAGTDTAACQAVSDGIYLLDLPSYHSPGSTQSAVCSAFSGWEAGLSGCGFAPAAYASKTVCKGWGISVVCGRSPSFTCASGSLKTATNTDGENGVVCCLPPPKP